MEYKSLLANIEEQKTSGQVTSKLYRYSGLVQAIEYFSHRLSFSQIIDASFDFVNELLLPVKSVLYCLDGEEYRMLKSRGYDKTIESLEPNRELKKTAVYHTGLIYDKNTIKKLFGDRILNTYDISIVIPLVGESKLYGFIFASDRVDSGLSEDDLIISESLMKLINNALDNYFRYEQLQQANSELDEKIFNLFAVNQSSKALLSELDLDKLYSLSVDVFAELTNSTVTGFLLYDTNYEKFRLKAYKNIFNYDACPAVVLEPGNKVYVDPNKVIIDVKKAEDREYFDGLFPGGMEKVESLDPRYIVLLVKNGEILGLVTLGETVTGRELGRSMFELVESLASSTYIAVSNAKYFREVIKRKEQLASRLETMMNLNSLLKNINSSQGIEGIISLTMKALEVSFRAEKALFALWDGEKQLFSILETAGFKVNTGKIPVKPKWERVLEGDIYFEVDCGRLSAIFEQELIEDIGPCSGVIIMPIYIEKPDVELIGAIFAFKFEDALINDEEKVLVLESVANHIAPVIRNLLNIKEREKLLVPNYAEMFRRDLKKEIEKAFEYNVGLQVVQVKLDRDFLFGQNPFADAIMEKYQKVYLLSHNNIFIILNETGQPFRDEIRDMLGEGEEATLRVFTLMEDFYSLEEFICCFEEDQ